MKEKIYSIFPFVDGQTLDSARFLFGSAEPKVDYIDGISQKYIRIDELTYE